MFGFNSIWRAPPSPRRGLYYPPEGGEVYASHREWAGAQPFATPGIAALAQWVINPSVHRCRIGKITLKQRDNRV